MMKHNVFKLIVSFIFCFSVCFSAWVYSSLTSTGKDLSLSKNENVNVTVHNLKQSTDVSITTEYSVPVESSVVVDEEKFLSDTDQNGNGQKEKWPDVGDKWKTIDWDEKTKYYNVDKNGKKTEIITHSTTGPGQIKYKNSYINVGEWKNVSDSSTWGNVWNVGYKSNEFYFYSNCEDSISLKMQYNKNDVLPNTENKISEKVEFDEKTGTKITTIIYERAIVRDTKKQNRGKWIIFHYVYGYYYPTYQYRRVVTKEKTRHQAEEISSADLKVKKGSCLSAVDLKLNNYKQYGFYTDSTCQTFFDFSKPLTSDVDLYVKQFETSSSDSLTIKINSLSSGSTLNVYNQAGGNTGGTSGQNYDIYSDPYYNEGNKACFIGNTVIQSGATVNLTYGNGSIYTEPIDGQINDSLGNHRTNTNSTISNEYDGTTYVGMKNCSTYMALGDDLTVKGTLNVGAAIGGHTGLSKYSYIIGKYSCLDLYGHNVYIDGGTLNAYGLIVDSVGTGKIYVRNNGKLESTLTVSDGRATRQMMLGISKRQSPFTEYRFSYLQVPVRFENGTTFQAYLKFELGEFGIANFHINFIGTSDALFLWNDSSTDSYIDYSFAKVNSVSSASLMQNCYNFRNRLSFNADVKQNYAVSMKIKITLSLGSASANVDFGRVDFPISPFFDLVLKSDHKMIVGSKITFYPGSSFYVEKGAVLSFTYTKDKVTYDGTSGVSIPGESRHMVGGIMSYTNHIGDVAANGYSEERFSAGIYNNSTYWKSFKTGNIQIDGNLEFDTSINTSDSLGDCYYLLSGNINLSTDSLKTLIQNRAYLKSYDFKAELTGGYLFSSTNVSVKDEYERAASYNANPLISNGHGYIFDSNQALEGTYTDGVLTESKNLSLSNDSVTRTDNNSFYFLEVDTDMYKDGSKGSNQTDSIDRQITISECTSIDSVHMVIRKGSTYFAYYKGIYVPLIGFSENQTISSDSTVLNANLRKFMSNSETDKEENYTKYSNCKIKFSSSAKAWTFVSFA